MILRHSTLERLLREARAEGARSRDGEVLELHRVLAWMEGRHDRLTDSLTRIARNREGLPEIEPQARPRRADLTPALRDAVAGFDEHFRGDVIAWVEARLAQGIPAEDVLEELQNGDYAKGMS